MPCTQIQTKVKVRFVHSGRVICKDTSHQKTAYKVGARVGSVLFVLLKHYWFWDNDFALNSFAEINSDWDALIKYVPKLMEVDFSGLRLLRHDYANQKLIDKKELG